MNYKALFRHYMEKKGELVERGYGYNFDVYASGFIPQEDTPHCATLKEIREDFVLFEWKKGGMKAVPFSLLTMSFPSD